MKKRRLLFVITQFYKGGAEVALLNLFRSLDPDSYEIDFLIFDQMPIPGAAPLLEELPDWICVCNAAAREGKAALLVKLWFKIWRRLTGRQLSRPAAKRFVRRKQYDAAFSYGEWMSPEFVATKVKAGLKFVWIHTDIDKANYVNEKLLFGWDSLYTNYLFVSEHSRDAALKRFSFLEGRTKVIHNLSDPEQILSLAKQPASEWKDKTGIKFITVGNLRQEKNYARHLAVLYELKQRGILFTWLAVGSTANPILYKQVNHLLEKYQLKENCFFIGAKENPYCYMAKADIVLQLSDYESWSLVITEAKIIGIPVIATATSGAKEQIEDGKTGILVSFDVKEIADRIELFIKHERNSGISKPRTNGIEIGNNGSSIRYEKAGKDEFEQIFGEE